MRVKINRDSLTVLWWEKVAVALLINVQMQTFSVQIQNRGAIVIKDCSIGFCLVLLRKMGTKCISSDQGGKIFFY